MLKRPTLKNLTNPDYGRPPKERNPILVELGKPHVDSFNYVTGKGLEDAVSDLLPIHFELPSKSKVSLRIADALLDCPKVPMDVMGVKTHKIFPRECKQRKATYKGRLTAIVAWSIDGIEQIPFTKELGEIPIMKMSDKCNLSNMSPEQLVAHGEHEHEWGGHFVVNGLDRLIRMLLMTRRNYPVAIKRSGWKSRGQLFSEYGILVRSVRSDQTSVTNVLHFLTDATSKFMFVYRKSMFQVPLMLLLKCLFDCSDMYIFDHLTYGYEDDLYYTDAVLNMLQELHAENLHSHDDCRRYLGKLFKPKFFECPDWFSDEEVADMLIKKHILIHLDSEIDKFNLLVFMTKKLYTFAQDKCVVEGVDAVMMQELLLGGHLYLQVLKERMQGWLYSLKLTILKRSKGSTLYGLNQAEIVNSARFAGNVEHFMEMFLATGNIKSPTGLGLMQDKGLTIVPENINRMRYMSHFKAVHRGAFFQQMRTTEARQLLPDAWGFICPVHTPDGAPCGLLNHLTKNCIVTDIPDEKKVQKTADILAFLGMKQVDNFLGNKLSLKEYYQTQLDGKMLGYVHKDIVQKVIKKLRLLKIEGERVPKTLEIVLVPIKEVKCQYPGLFLFTGPARMMRPVLNLSANNIELIGTFEQVYLDICVKPKEIYNGVTTHMELSKTAFLSNIASLIPLPDYNQSPRNMYQCQMGKQSMGTPCHNWNEQAETKLYRLQTPATPLFRPVHYDNIGLDDFPMGVNAIVGVLSYTGYDMEDAMVINKWSNERGFAHGSIYKTEFIELEQVNSYFCRDPKQQNLEAFLDTDGLPFVGRLIQQNEPLYCYCNLDEARYIVSCYKGKEECYVNSVRLCGNFSPKKPRLACITLRVPRNPSVGDKFASRAGQKGICSQKWPAEDMPFTETGMVPDIIFNPHGFPSRMTIAMMIEIMSGKTAAIHGFVHDATPFKFTEQDTAIDYFGRILEESGYNYYGNETMYSGIDGREMSAQMFFGIVHYQRLRHMVSDKWQVRSTGPRDILTRQPIKGRKRGGGVRFGEMERDCLLSHGASFLLQDRLFHNSDKCLTFICTKCDSILSPITVVTRMADKAHLIETKEMCRLCGSDSNISEIEIPYIFKFFVAQLASCNINIKLKCKHV